MLRALGPAHQVGDDVVHVPALVENFIGGLGNGHLHPGLLGQRPGVGGGIVALHHRADLVQRLLDRRIFPLSSGEKQLIAIASVCTMEPKVIVMDEPSANLDSDAMVRLGALLYRLKEAGHTILLSEHRFHYVCDSFDRLVFMENGEISAIYSRSEALSLTEGQLAVMGLRPFQPPAFRVGGAFLSKPEDAFQASQISCMLDGRQILEDVTFSARSGRILAIAGPNGAGKSTLCRTITGLCRAMGTVQIDGAYLKLEGASLETGDTLSFSSVTENAWNSSVIAPDGPEKVLTLNGGSVRNNFICVYKNADGNVLQEYGIASVINLTGNTEDGASYASLPHFTATSADQYKDALLFMLDNPGPYLFICDDQESFSIPLLVSMLMGARLEQIRNDYLASFGFTADSDEGRAVMNDINLMLEAMNGGTLPNDSQLLSLSIDYLNLRLGLSFTEIPLLRLSLR